MTTISTAHTPSTTSDPDPPSSSSDGPVVAVVGAGVIGLAIAWRAASAGRRVVLIDPKPGSGASRVAGGMLAPVSEAWPGEDDLLALGSTSLELWPRFAAELRAASGRDPGLRTDGTIVVAVDSADREQLHDLAKYLAHLGRAVEELGGRELRRLEPTLGPTVRGGLLVPGDLAVDNRRLLDALWRACTLAGVRHVAAAAARVRPGRVGLADGTTVDCDTAVIAAGAWSGSLHPELADVVRPVKGEVLRLRARPSALPPPSRTVRAVVEGRNVYAVPRDDGGLVLGATQYEAGFDTDVGVAGVRDLLRDGEVVLPGIAEYALVECSAGLRPGSPDNLPVIRTLEPGVIAATGHFRNGILLAPVTAGKVMDLL